MRGSDIPKTSISGNAGENADPELAEQRSIPSSSPPKLNSPIRLMSVAVVTSGSIVPTT